MSGDNASSADNQQETPYYFCGFMVGECSISVIKATNKKGGSGFYFTPDFTISNLDFELLVKVNDVAAVGKGIITPIKGGYNLSIRGKSKVGNILSFFDQFPPLCGDIVNERLMLLRKAVSILLAKENRNSRLPNEESEIEAIRTRLKSLKSEAKASLHFPLRQASSNEIGNFLAGIVDAEGSMGFRQSGKYLQPYFSVGMRDKEIIELFHNFTGCGSIYYRPAQKLYHFETGKRENVLKFVNMFLEDYPVHIPRNQKRMQKVRWILNDYTPRIRFWADHDIV